LPPGASPRSGFFHFRRHFSAAAAPALPMLIICLPQPGSFQRLACSAACSPPNA